MSTLTNLADAIAGLRDGTLGTQQVKIGSLVVSALLGLSIPRKKKITKRPVQAGYAVAMGVIDVPDEIEMDIVLADPVFLPEGMVASALTGLPEEISETWKEKKDLLYSMFDEKEIVDLTTHEVGYPPIYVIKEIDPKYEAEEDWDGWIGTVRLAQFGAQDGTSAVDMDDAKTAATAYVGSF